MKKNLIIRLISVIIIIIAMIFIISFFTPSKNENTIVSKSDTKILGFDGFTGECTNEPYYIDVKSNNDIDVLEYSIDNGESWQENSKFLISENGTYLVKTKDKNGLESETRILNINNIDKEGPVLNVPLSTIIYRNDKLDLTKNVSAYDNCSAISSIEIIPSSIYTSRVGEYDILYKASDKFGNTSEQVRRVIVKENEETSINQTQRTTRWYRYRTLKTTTSNCGTYECNCKNEKIDISYTCPSGYTLNGTKCEKNVTVSPRTYSCSTGSYDSDTNTCYNREYYYCDEGGTIYNTNKCKYRAYVYDQKYCDVVINGECYVVESAFRYPNNNYVKIIIPNATKTPICPTSSKLTNGKCLKIETINATKTCPVGYNINGTKCVSIAKNDCDTCNKTCESSYWSEWSNWSTTKVLETSTRQVETREV